MPDSDGGMSGPGDAKDAREVRPALRKAEAELAHHLQEACDDPESGIDERSTDELLRLEEELLAAARAADKTIRLRQRLTEGGGEAAPRGSAPKEKETPPASAPADAAGTRVREFRTASGSEWRVWEVRPGAGGRPSKAELYPADYANGWLAFELLQGEGRKRLPNFTPEWSDAADTELERLLDRAVEVPKRRRSRPEEPDPGLSA
jgi:hypothetical protein